MRLRTPGGYLPPVVEGQALWSGGTTPPPPPPDPEDPPPGPAPIVVQGADTLATSGAVVLGGDLFSYSSPSLTDNGDGTYTYTGA